MTSKQLSRRRILKTLAATAAAPLVIPGRALGRDGNLAPSDRITIGFCGVGQRGTSAWKYMQPLPDHQVVAIADCRNARAEKAQKQINDFYADKLGKPGFQGCDTYADFRDLLARDDIDAVWGTVPDHWHGVLFKQVLESSKDLYGEKPVTRRIAEGVKIREAVRQHDCVFQTGTQQRSSPHFRHACELVHNGYLGTVKRIEVAAPAGRTYPTAPSCDPPSGFDYDMWTGPAEFIPFDEVRCEWLAMYMISQYCAGFITNWGVHHLDIAGWGCPEVLEKPFTVDGSGVMPEEGMTDTWINWQMQLKWESGLMLSYSNTDNPHQQGCRFIGDEGWVHVNRKGISANPTSLVDLKLKPSDVRLHASPEHANAFTSHAADFFRSIRSRKDPVAPVESGHASSTLGNVCDIALRLGKKLTWDPTADRFVDAPDADAMLSHPMRAPWTM